LAPASVVGAGAANGGGAHARLRAPLRRGVPEFFGHSTAVGGQFARDEEDNRPETLLPWPGPPAAPGDGSAGAWPALQASTPTQIDVEIT